MKLQLLSIIIGFLILLVLIGNTYVYAINPPKGSYESKSFQITNMSAIYKGSFIGDNYEVLGIIKNKGNQTFDEVSLYITLHDKNGNLIGLEKTTPIFSNVGNPGNSSEFKFDISTNSSLFDRYIVKVGVK
jgi:hypothetical protein